MSQGEVPPPVRAAGCLVWRRVEGRDQIELGLVHRQRHDDWSLPKGKLERGEKWPAAAVREVLEETGHAVVLGPPLPTQHYTVDGAPKEVRYWAAQVRSRPTDVGAEQDDGFVANDEVDAVRWLDPVSARTQLSYPHDADVLDAFMTLVEALDGSAGDVFIVLRHARAMKRRVWRGADEERPLEDRGIEEAEGLVAVLGAYGIDEIHSSNTRRCMDTVEPYAVARHLAVVPEPHVSERGHRHKPDAAGRRTTRLLESGGRVVLCSHRPVLPAILEAALGSSEGVAAIGTGLPPSAMVVVHHVGGRVLAMERHDP
jgi:8-oxo-(d)GTP phosphatase